jgi:sporulation-control protein spo0M
MEDGSRIVGEYDGRELMWDFEQGARELRGFVAGLPIDEGRYGRLVTRLRDLEEAVRIDDLVALTLPGKR